jgi:uncharacterized protein (UPF0261 family)
MLSLGVAWRLLALALTAFGLPGLVEAGSIGWADLAADASGSMQGMATESVPLVVGAGVMAAALHLPGMTTALLATGGATYVAANADQVQGIIGGGGAGGLITDIVLPAGYALPMLI